MCHLLVTIKTSVFQSKSVCCPDPPHKGFPVKRPSQKTERDHHKNNNYYNLSESFKQPVCCEMISGCRKLKMWQSASYCILQTATLLHFPYPHSFLSKRKLIYQFLQTGSLCRKLFACGCAFFSSGAVALHDERNLIDPFGNLFHRF